jgi:RNA polymerase sigma factor (sigma-70 family)
MQAHNAVPWETKPACPWEDSGTCHPPCLPRDCRLYMIGHACALWVGLTGEEPEDCATEFVERMREREGCPFRSDRSERLFIARVCKCVLHHSLNYQRKLAIRQRHERPLSEITRHEDVCAPWNPAGDRPTVESLLLREEFREKVMEAMDELPPARWELFCHYHLLDESIQALALATGKSYDAVRKTLSRAQKQAQERLLRQGVTEADLREYLAT